MGAGHGGKQRKRQGTAAYHAALILQYQMGNPSLLPLQQGGGQRIFKIDLAGLSLRQGAETRASVVRQCLQIHRIAQLLQQLRLAAASGAGDDPQWHARWRLLQSRQQELAQRLVATNHPGYMTSTLCQPSLYRLRAQAAAKTVEQGVRVLPDLGKPGFNPGFP